MKLVNFRRLKIGRRSRLRERKRSLNWDINHQLIKIKFTLEKIRLAETALQIVQVDRETIRPCGATEHNLGDREMVLAHQGGAVVPDGVTAHEIERPETHD